MHGINLVCSRKDESEGTCRSIGLLRDPRRAERSTSTGMLSRALLEGARTCRRSLASALEGLSGPITEDTNWCGSLQRGILMEKQASLALETERSERLLFTPPSDNAASMLALIERVALDPRADVEKLERMMAMYQRLKAKETELAYNAAKARILKKLAGIKIVKSRSVLPEIDKGKPKKGTYQAFKYAPLEEIDKHLRPLLVKEDMDLSYSDEPRDDGSILIRGRLKHLPGGHYEDSFMPARSTPRVVSRVCRQSGAPILFFAAMSPAISSTS
jgi:hypothetical protein